MYQEKGMDWSKPETFLDLVKLRSSQRTFLTQGVDIRPLIEAARHAPSSCNRQAISIQVVTDRDQKELLGGILVGGAGWCHRADTILLLLADQKAYVAGDEIKYMPYLDAGV